jgi:hypothetical protein
MLDVNSNDIESVILCTCPTNMILPSPVKNSYAIARCEYKATALIIVMSPTNKAVCQVLLSNEVTLPDLQNNSSTLPYAENDTLLSSSLTKFAIVNGNSL